MLDKVVKSVVSFVWIYTEISEKHKKYVMFAYTFVKYII